MIYQDFLELLRVFESHRVAYAIIGGYAVGLHAEPRYTKDLDLLVEATPKNAKAVLAALTAFGAPIANLSVEELSTPGLLYVFGISPLRVDILNRIKGANSSSIIKRAERFKFGDINVSVVSRSDLLKLKRLAGRPQDLADIAKIKQLATSRKKPKQRSR